MKLHSVDIGIILVYFLAMILIGIWVSRRGSKDLIRQDGNEFFMVIFGMMFFKGVLAGVAENGGLER